jgi:hypothetical protein
MLEVQAGRLPDPTFSDGGNTIARINIGPHCPQRSMLVAGLKEARKLASRIESRVTMAAI